MCATVRRTFVDFVENGFQLERNAYLVDYNFLKKY